MNILSDFFTTGVQGPELCIVTTEKNKVTSIQEINSAEYRLSCHVYWILKSKLGLEGEGFFQLMLYPKDMY